MTQKNKQELLPCPFCGGEPYTENQFLSVRQDIVGQWRVVCSNCWIYIPTKATANEAIKLWNTRYNQDEVYEGINKILNQKQKTIDELQLENAKLQQENERLKKGGCHICGGKPCSDLCSFQLAVSSSEFGELYQENERLKKELENLTEKYNEATQRACNNYDKYYKTKAELDKHKWISVDERLPKKEYYYEVAVLKDGDLCHEVLLWKENRWYFFGMFEGSVHWDLIYWHEEINGKILYWKESTPLPDPPESQENK